MAIIVWDVMFMCSDYNFSLTAVPLYSCNLLQRNNMQSLNQWLTQLFIVKSGNSNTLLDIRLLCLTQHMAINRSSVAAGRVSNALRSLELKFGCSAWGVVFVKVSLDQQKDKLRNSSTNPTYLWNNM